MPEPCIREKEIEFLKDHAHSVNGNLIKMGDDISHIKDRLDHGISVTITESAKVLEQVRLQMAEVVPVINRHTNLEKRIEDIFWWITKILITVIIGVVIWALAHGAKVGVGINP